MEDRPRSLVSSSPRVERVSGVRRLGWLSLFGGTCAVAGGAYAVAGRGIPCPFLAATGWLCPLCGSSRMAVALLHGDPVAAWGWNPFALVLALLLFFAWSWTLVRLILRREVALPGPLGVLERWSPGLLLTGLAVPGLGFMVLRNLL